MHTTQLCGVLRLLAVQVSALPVVNEQGVLLDIYARADITQLCKGNAYSRLQWEDVTVSLKSAALHITLHASLIPASEPTHASPGPLMLNTQQSWAIDAAVCAEFCGCLSAV